MTTAAAQLTVGELLRQGYTKSHAEAAVAWMSHPAPAVRRIARTASARQKPARRRSRAASPAAEIRAWAIQERPDLGCPAAGRIPARVSEAWNSRPQ
jgi:hypothetical protein